MKDQDSKDKVSELLRQTEDALRASELRYRRLFESAQDGILILDFDTGRILDVNPYLIDMLGYFREEFLEKCLWEISPFKDTALNKEFFETLQREGYVRYEDLPLETSDGLSIGAEFVSNAYLVDGVSFIQCNIRDISARKRSEGALRESEERLRRISLMVSDIAYSCIKQPSGAYSIDWMTGGVEHLTSYSVDDLKSLGCWRSLVVDEDLPVFDHHVIGLAPGTTGSCELRLRQKTGEIVWVSSFAECVVDRESLDSRRLYGGLVDITDRKKAEENLRETERRYRRLFEQAPSMYVITRNEQGVPFITDCNELFLTSLGYTREEVQGKPLADLYTPESRSDLLAGGGYARTLAGEFFIGERQLVKSDGSRVPTLLYTTTEVDPSGQVTGTRAMFVDITDRKKAEETLHQSEQMLKAILSASPVGIVATRDRRIRWANDAWIKMFGFTSEQEYLDQPTSILHHSQDYYEHARKILYDGLQPGQVSEADLTLKRKDGTSFDSHIRIGLVDASDPSKGTISAITDISDRKKAEEALRQSDERNRFLAGVIENSSQPFGSGYPDGRLGIVNRAFCNLTGYSEEELRHIEWNVTLTPPEWRESEMQHLTELERTGNPVRYEKEYIRKDGTRVPIELLVHVVRGETGEPLHYEAFLTDLTERKRSEEMLLRAKKDWEDIFQAIGHVTLIVDLEGTILSANQAAINSLGKSEEEVIGKKCYDLFHRLDNHPDGCPLTKLRQTGEFTIEEMEVEALGGYYLVTCTPIVDETGSVQRVIHIATDITRRKQAEESAYRANQDWERTFNAISDPVMVLDDKHKILRANKAMADALGMTEQEVIGKSCFELVHGEKEPPAFCPHTQLLKDGEEHLAEVVEPRLGGLYDMRVSPLVGQNGQVIGSVHIIRDITERKMKEEALLESEERFRLTFQTSPDAININRLSDGLYLDVNDGFTEITGYSREEVIGKSSLELDIWHNPQDRQRLVESLKEAGYVPNLEAEFRFKDGTVITGLMSARVIMLKGELHIVSITRNIEEWRRTQEALRESEQRYRTLFEESIDGVYSVLKDGEITEANASFCKLFGYTREELIGKDIRELYLDPADRPKFQEEIEKEGFVKDYEVKFRKRDGTEVDCLLTSSVHFGQDGSITGYRGILRDLTIRKRLQRQLLQAQKMEAIGTLAGGIAHDFNNLLQVVLGYSELVLADEDLPDRLRDDLRKVLLAGKNGADLVQRLLTFSRRTETKPLNLDLNQRIRQTQKFLERTVPKMINIEMILAEDLVRIYADPTQVDQVLMNLAVNARDAMPEGGKLIVETANVVIDEVYARSHVEAKPGPHVLLRVSDTGSGMDKETLGHIFEPFFTTKGLGQGTGLGLAMVFGIVNQHHGFINCYSEVGHGTTFNIYLPAILAEPEEVAASLAEMPAFGTETVLLVDDEDLVRELGQRILTRSGYTVLTAANGEEALDLYVRMKDQIHLVILDLVMPTMGGKECLKGLLKVDPQARILIASGYSADASTKEYVELGAKGFVAKPFRFKELLKEVRKTLDES